jgi:hypothetical protein
MVNNYITFIFVIFTATSQQDTPTEETETETPTAAMEQAASAELPASSGETAAFVMTSIDMAHFLQNCKTPGISTMEQEINHIIAHVQKARLTKFGNEVYVYLKGSIKDFTKKTNVYRITHAFMLSSDYKNMCAFLFETASPLSAHLVIASQLTLKIRDALMFPEDLTVPGTSAELASVAPSGFGKVRHIGGMCIAKILQHYRLRLRKTLNSTQQELVQVEAFKDNIDALNHLIISEHELEETTLYIDSLQETKRRQNIRKSLTHITDMAFKFFLRLEKLRLPLYSSSNVLAEPQKVLITLSDKILGNVELFQEWTRLFVNYELSTDEPEAEGDHSGLVIGITRIAAAVTDCFHSIVGKYLRVCHSQFRKQLLADIKRKKDLAHRKKIQAREAKSQLLSIQDLRVDDEQNAQLTHLKLQTEILQRQDALTKLTVPQLKTVLGWYNVVRPKRTDKAGYIKLVKEQVLTSETILL